jgi:Na+-transporting NADH:ubiquinone oxidoreductase subunit C
MKSGLYWERFFPIIFMLAITVIFIGVVSGIFLATRDLVRLNESLFLKKSVLFSADIALPEKGAEIDALYRTRVREVKGPDEAVRYFEILDERGAEVTGYTVFAYGPGLWGEIGAVLGFDKSLEKLTGIDFIKQNETPGLGARIMEDWFREQFRGRKGPFVLVPEGTAEGENELDAITGASYTSSFVLSLVNSSVAEVNNLVGR